MKKFNWSIFLYSTIIAGFLLVTSFVAALAEDEGTRGSGLIGLALYKLFYILRFPTHTLLWDLFSSSTDLYFFGLVLNCIFYGLIVERMIFVIRRKSQSRSS
jgi:hypothetical protein